MNTQELFIDVSSGRFLDGNSAIPITKPNIFGNEKRTFKINVLEIKRNVISQKSPSENASFQVRLGTPTLKLSDGEPPSTAPINTIRAIANVVTSPSVQAIGNSSLYTYTPITASIISTIATYPIVTGIFNLNVNYVAPVTASIVGSYSTNLASTITKPLKFTETGIAKNYQIGGIQSPVNFATELNSPVTAIFSATVLGGEIVKIDITNKGRGYPSGSYALSFGGAATATVSATANAVAAQGFIQSITISCGGIGYSGTPSVTLFCPAKQLILSGSGIVDLSVKGVNTSTVALNFSEPDGQLTPPQSKKPAGTIAYTGQGTEWIYNITDAGYGYSSSPTVSHSDILAYLPVSSVVTSSSRNGAITNLLPFGGTTNLISSVVTRTFSQEPKKINMGGLRFYDFKPLLTWLSGTSQNAENLSYRGGAIFYGKGTVSKQENPYLDQIAKPSFSKISKLYYDAGISVTGSIFGPKNLIWTPSQGSSPSGTGAIDRQAWLQYQDSGVLGVVTGQILVSGTTPEAINNNFATGDIFGKKCKVAILPSDRSFVPTRYAVAEIEIPPQDTSYGVGILWQIKALKLSGSSEWEYGGGKYTPKITMLDMGEGYSSSYRGGYDIIELGSIEDSGILLETSLPISYNIPSSTTRGFLNTAFSEQISIATKPGNISTQYIIGSYGTGYFQDTSIGFTTVQTTGYVKSASLSNSPKSYSNGIFECAVQPPPSGNTAKINLIVKNNQYSVAVIDGGSGYTSAPIITAPTPNFISGQIESVSVLTKPLGYSENTKFFLSVPTSSEANGTGEVSFTITSDGLVNTVIENSGFGYTSNQVATAPDPDQRFSNGFVKTFEIQNSPEGYVVGEAYDLKVQESPQSGGSAIARLIRKSSSAYEIEIINAGAGYTSAPIVTAPSPNAPNGLIASVAVSTAGLGYAPGTYETTVGTAPAGGQTAIVNYIVEPDGSTRFDIVNSGQGYSSAPQISVPTPAGNIVSGITIICQGSYYTSANAVPIIQDALGQGAQLQAPVINNGKITSINIANSGYGFSNSPKIVFNKPPAPIQEVLQTNQIERTFDITTASANAILTTANQRDVLLEVYETDGTNEQVVVQGVVNLTKRVLE